jgi:hypothetical protein
MYVKQRLLPAPRPAGFYVASPWPKRESGEGSGELPKNPGFLLEWAERPAIRRRARVGTSQYAKNKAKQEAAGPVWSRGRWRYQGQ